MLPVILAAAALGARTADPFTVTDRLPTSQRSTHYAGNREPLTPSPLVKLPVGAVRPDGWLKKQLELQAAGFHGRLTEISSFLKKEGNAWLSNDGQGDHGWEEVPYWLKGFISCAFLTDNQEQIAEAKTWIDAAIASQVKEGPEAGMFGPRGKGAAATVSSTKGPLDLWPNMVMLNCLQTWHEATGDPRVIDLMTKYFRFELTIPDKDFLPPYWQNQRGGDNLASVYWLYNRTGEPWLLELATKIRRCMADWSSGIPDWHNVNMTQAFGCDTFFWQQSRLEKDLSSADRNWHEMRNTYGQVPGGMFGGDENCRPGYSDPRQAIETCGMVEMMYTCERLFAVTGDSIWADRCEDVAFNSLPAAVMADFSGLRYLTAPNHIKSDASPKHPHLENGGNMLEMRCDDHRCCQHNFGHGWPYLAEHLWLATADDGLAAFSYCAGRVTATVGPAENPFTATIITSSDYPFSEEVSFAVDAPPGASFPIYLRIPSWCKNAGLRINGQKLPLKAAPGAFFRLELAWKQGDSITLELPMEVSLRTWAKNHDSVSVDRGPLTYSLKVPEKYVRGGGTPEFPGAQIFPESPWNYGLILPKPASPAALSRAISDTFRVVRRPYPADDMPFTLENAPIEIHARGRKIPQWKEDYLGLVGLLQESPARTSEPAEELTLIPMGAARLRITSFPTVLEPGASDAQAHEWAIPPEAYPLHVSASYCNPKDLVRAVADRVEPKSSSDRVKLRMTWWDHKGTSEWIQRDFDEKRTISRTEVYWFDDEATDGKCRTPASWRVLYRDAKGVWQPVKLNGQTPGVAKDAYNAADFEPVQTDALRLEVQLRPQFSAGILQWRVPGPARP
jgi:hypothetical protein